MPGIGDTLREARMRQKVDIAEVEEKTKIRAKYLRALENEEWGLLPGGTFIRSFLRTYAEFLGIDPQLLVEEYRVHHDPREQVELQPIGPPAPNLRDRAPRRAPGPGFVIGLVVAALLGFLLILGLTGDEEDGGGGGETTSAERNTRTAEERPRRPARKKKRRAVAPRNRVSVRIAPVDGTYVCVDDGKGRVLFEGSLTEPRTFRGKRVRVNLGRRSARLVVNGKRVAIEDGAEPIGFDITPRRQKELREEDRPCVG